MDLFQSQSIFYLGFIFIVYLIWYICQLDEGMCVSGCVCVYGGGVVIGLSNCCKEIQSVPLLLIPYISRVNTSESVKIIRKVSRYNELLTFVYGITRKGWNDGIKNKLCR